MDGYIEEEQMDVEKPASQQEVPLKCPDSILVELEPSSQQEQFPTSILESQPGHQQGTLLKSPTNILESQPHNQQGALLKSPTNILESQPHNQQGTLLKSPTNILESKPGHQQGTLLKAASGDKGEPACFEKGGIFSLVLPISAIDGKSPCKSQKQHKSCHKSRKKQKEKPKSCISKEKQQFKSKKKKKKSSQEQKVTPKEKEFLLALSPSTLHKSENVKENDVDSVGKKLVIDLTDDKESLKRSKQEKNKMADCTENPPVISITLPNEFPETATSMAQTRGYQFILPKPENPADYIKDNQYHVYFSNGATALGVWDGQNLRLAEQPTIPTTGNIYIYLSCIHAGFPKLVSPKAKASKTLCRPIKRTNPSV